MFKTFKNSFLDEIYSIRSSFYKFSLISILPILCFLLVISIFYSGVLRDIPVAVVDNDKSKLSKKLLFNLQSSSTIKIKYTDNSLRDAMLKVKDGSVYGVIVIPKNFMKDTLLQKQPRVTAMLNTQYILIGKILTSALTSVVMQSSMEVEYVKSLATTQNPHTTINLIAPIKMQITPFFNTYQNYFLFLVSALLPAIWQIFIVVATIVSFGTLFKNSKNVDILKGSYVEVKIIARLLPYTFAYTTLGIGFLFYIYQTLQWSFQGSFGITIFAIFLTVVAYQAVALLFFSTSFDYARSLSLGAVYTAPAFAFLGVTFPIFSMNDFALLWRNMLPISHYMEIQISQANYGANIFLEIDKLVVIFAFWLLFIPVFYLFRKRVAK